MSETVIADEVVSKSIATVQGAVAGFDAFQAGIAAIEAAHPRNVVCDLTTTAGMKQAIAGRAAWRDPRIALEKARKNAKAPVIELGKAIDAFAGRIEAELRIGESNYDGQIKAHEKAEQDAAIARAKAEQERKARHEAGLTTIRNYVQRAMGLDSTKLAAGIEALAAQRYGAEWEEFASPAVIAQTETLETLRSMYNIALQREQEAAERERQRLENERLKRELEEERARLEEQKRLDNEAAEAKRAAEAAAAKEAAEALHQAQLQLALQQEAVRAEAARLAAIAQEQAEREAKAREVVQVVPDWAGGTVSTMSGEIERTVYESVVAEEFAEVAPSAMVSFVAGDPPMGALADLHAAELPAEEATLKLGDVCARIGVTMSAEFVTETLGVPRRVQGGRAFLFYPSDFERIRLAFIAHLEKLA